MLQMILNAHNYGKFHSRILILSRNEPILLVQTIGLRCSAIQRNSALVYSLCSLTYSLCYSITCFTGKYVIRFQMLQLTKIMQNNCHLNYVFVLLIYILILLSHFIFGFNRHSSNSSNSNLTTSTRASNDVESVTNEKY